MRAEDVRARGHPNIRSEHRNTLEFTKEAHLTPRGDCIVAVAADKGMAELTTEFKEALRTRGARLKITIECGGVEDTVEASGHPGLILDHPTDMVVRKTDYICPRTLAVRADKAAMDLDRRLVEKLRQALPVSIKLSVTSIP